MKTRTQFMADKKLKAMTLTEVLIVLVIVGILTMLALPNFMNTITKAKSTEAKLQLESVHTLQKTYFYEFSKYSDNLEAIDFEQVKLTTEGGSANYKIDIVQSTNTTFIARATAVVDFDGDGQMNVWEIDQDKQLVEVTKD